MSAFALRTATAADADAIATLHTANWRSAYAAILDPAYLAGPVIEDRHAVWRERLTSPAPDMEVVVAENDQGIVGFVSLFHEREPAWGGFVDNLHSAAAVRGQGAGKALLVEAARRTAASQRKAFTCGCSNGTRVPSASTWRWVRPSLSVSIPTGTRHPTKSASACTGPRLQTSRATRPSA